jgi:hypothetical protein
MVSNLLIYNQGTNDSQPKVLISGFRNNGSQVNGFWQWFPDQRFTISSCRLVFPALSVVSNQRISLQLLQPLVSNHYCHYRQFYPSHWLQTLGFKLTVWIDVLKPVQKSDFTDLRAINSLCKCGFLTGSLSGSNKI